MYKKGKILIFCMIFAATAAFAQKRGFKMNGLATFNTADTVIALGSIQLNTNYSLFFSPYKSIISSNYYSNALGIICRQEIKLDKKLPISFRFRLGSVEQCNLLEGKGLK
jgi:hypothetical protein